MLDYKQQGGLLLALNYQLSHFLRQKWVIRGKKGLCFLCSAKYIPSYRCNKAHLYQLVINPLTDTMELLNGVNSEEFQDCPEQLDVDDYEAHSSFSALSLHGLQDT